MRPVSKTPPLQTLPGVTRADSIAAPAAETREETAVWRIALRVAAGILGLLALAIHPAIFLPAAFLFGMSHARARKGPVTSAIHGDLHEPVEHFEPPHWDHHEMVRLSKV